MLFFQQSRFLIATATTSLLRHKMRSLLTILSIIIGIATVIATLAIGRGAQEKIRNRLSKLGVNALSLYAGTPYQGNKPIKKRLTIYDSKFLRTFDSRIKQVSSLCRSQETQVIYASQNISSPVNGAEPEALTISNRTLALGRNILTSDMQTSASVAIIGSAIAEKLFRQTSPLGKVVFIENNPFKIIGVMAKQESPYTFYDTNKEVYIPLTTWKRLYSSNPDTVHSIMMSIALDADITQVERLIRRAMRARHQIEGDKPDDFTLWNQSSMMAAAEQSSQTLNLLLLIVASLSLFVGGLGVSNIMLVTVTERTKEIGIRMALGASPRMILAQFLIEAVTLCIVGGLIGVLLGALIPYILTFFVNWHVVVSTMSIVFSVCSTSFIGLFFGYIPAYKASKLAIVTALHDQ